MNQNQAQEAILNGRAFTASALSGHEGFASDAGRLYGTDLEAFLMTFARAEYTVKSYATPVAWFVPGEGWTVVSNRYSATTSKHVGAIRRTLADRCKTTAERVSDVLAVAV